LPGTAGILTVQLRRERRHAIEATARPRLDTRPSADVFLSFYYLKAELQSFCRANGLSAAGDKETLTRRVEQFLRNGLAVPEKRLAPAARARRSTATAIEEPSLDALIGEDFHCTERARAFFESLVGGRFHFSVRLQRYLKQNPAATYAQAIEEWRRLERSGPTETIDPQFEYNRYIRAFFRDNPGRPLADAISCWKLRRTMPGPRAYSREDLRVLLIGESGTPNIRD
jgi:hypothetical protein